MAPADVHRVVEVEVFSKAPNASIVRLPWRKFPGIVVQGDSLSILVDLLEHYAQTLSGAGIQLPYVRGESGGE